MTKRVTRKEDKAGRMQDFVDHLSREAVFARLSRIELGELALIEAGTRHAFGSPDSGPSATITIRDPAFYRYIATRGAIGGGEAYMDGHFEADDLAAVIRIMARNRKAIDHLDGKSGVVWRHLLRFIHWARRNDREGSRRNIAEHYDLGNDFFELFLDPTMTYSCGIFESEDASMEQASIAKYDRICKKLGIGKDDHVLEIGSGWGGFAIHAAGHYGCRVTTTTISEQQYDLARERIRLAGLEDRIDLLRLDYRDLKGKYDKIVSIEMIEAVGVEHWDDYFRICGERLEPDGMMAIQAISVRDQDFASSRRSVDFIKRYIFPGGQLVSHAALCASMARVSDLHVTHFEDITAHYARTLARWHERMTANIESMRALGLPERFLAMWEYYLCYCQGSFSERAINVFQMVFEKPLCRRDPLLGELSAGS
jgi:cyclopropane-fatty-acyl-phospholipid synthase